MRQDLDPEPAEASVPCATAERAGAIELVVTDLDGTLWDGTGRIHPRTLGALEALAVASIPVLAATGRSARSAWSVMEGNRIALPGVFLDGAIGLEFGSTTAYYKCEFTPVLAAEMLEILDRLGVSPCISVEGPGHDIVLGEHPMIHPEYLRRLQPWVREEDPWTAVQTLNVLAFSLLAPDLATAHNLASEVTARLNVAAAVSPDRTYGGAHLSFRPLGVNKWTGVLAFCTHSGLDPDHVLAIGDADNDVELLEGASVALAVSDATPSALQRADQVLAPASHGGWAELVEIVGLPSG